MRTGCEAHVHTVLGIPLHLEFSLADVACHSLILYTPVEDFHGEHHMKDQAIRDVIIPAAKRILAK